MKVYVDIKDDGDKTVMIHVFEGELDEESSYRVFVEKSLIKFGLKGDQSYFAPAVDGYMVHPKELNEVIKTIIKDIFSGQLSDSSEFIEINL